MPFQTIRSELLALLEPGLAQRGFSRVPLTKKEAGTRRHDFRKLTHHGHWMIELDLHAQRGVLSVCMCPYAVIDAIAALLSRGKHSAEVSMGVVMHPHDSWVLSDGEPIEPVAKSILGIIDSVVIPHLDRYADPARLLEALSPFDHSSARQVFGGADPQKAMTAVAAAYLLGRLDDCDRIAIEAGALWHDPLSRIPFREFVDLKHDFYERRLRGRGIKPDAWLYPPEVEARWRAEHPPEPYARPLPSPAIWIDGARGKVAPARFEYGYQLRVIGSDNREFVPSLSEVAHKLTTGSYALMMASTIVPPRALGSEPYPVSFRNLVIDGKWAMDWTPPDPT